MLEPTRFSILFSQLQAKPMAEAPGEASTEPLSFGQIKDTFARVRRTCCPDSNPNANDVRD